MKPNKTTHHHGQKTLLQSGVLVSSMTLLSRILGLFRDIVIANAFGASSSSDAFFVAFKIPNFFRRLFAEGAFAQAFVPLLSEYRSQRKIPEIRSLIDHAFGSLALVLASISGLAVACAPVLIYLFAPGFSQQPEKQALAVDMLRFTFPYLLLISLAAFLGAVQNTYQRFFAPAFAPVLLNISLIVAVLLSSQLVRQPPVMALAYGVLFAGIVQCAFQVPFVMQLHRLPRPKIKRQHDGVKRILLLMGPALFGVSVSQINLLLDTVLASFLVTGSVSWLYYSDRLMELPLGIFGVAIATVILPSLAKRHSESNRAAFQQTLDVSLRLVCLIGVPAALALILLAEPLLITLFQYGAFDAVSVEQASLSLRAYALGLLPFMLIKVLASGYYSRQDTKTPVRIGIIAMVTNMVFNLLLIVPLAHVGLALATAISAMVNAGLLWRGLLRADILGHQAKRWLTFSLRLIVASLVMASALIWVSPSADLWLSFSVEMRISVLAGVCILGVVSYFSTLWLLGFRVKDFQA